MAGRSRFTWSASIKRERLYALTRTRQQKLPVVLVRGLTSGLQFIVTPRESLGDIDLVEPTVRDAARAAMDREGATTLESGGEQFLIQTLVAPPRIIISS